MSLLVKYSYIIRLATNTTRTQIFDIVVRRKIENKRTHEANQELPVLPESRVAHNRLVGTGTRKEEAKVNGICKIFNVVELAGSSYPKQQ